MEINATIFSQVLVFSVIFTWLTLPFLASYLAKNRNQSRLLWFIITLIFPIAVAFIAMKDKNKAED